MYFRVFFPSHCRASIRTLHSHSSSGSPPRIRLRWSCCLLSGLCGFCLGVFPLLLVGAACQGRYQTPCVRALVTPAHYPLTQPAPTSPLHFAHAIIPFTAEASPLPALPHPNCHRAGCVAARPGHVHYCGSCDQGCLRNPNLYITFTLLCHVLNKGEAISQGTPWGSSSKFCWHGPQGLRELRSHDSGQAIQPVCRRMVTSNMVTRPSMRRN